MDSPNHDNDPGPNQEEPLVASPPPLPKHHRHRPLPITPPHHIRSSSSSSSSSFSPSTSLPRPPPQSPLLVPTNASPSSPTSSQPMTSRGAVAPCYGYSNPWMHPQYMSPYMNQHQPMDFSMMHPHANLQGFDHHRPWNTGLFDCCEDVKGCLFTLLCPCISFPQIIEIITEGQTPWWEHAIACSWLAIMSFGIIPIWCIWLYRQKMRESYKLKGDDLWDCVLSNFFPHFVICQLRRQLRLYGYNVSTGWKANMEKLQENIERQQLIELAAMQCQPPEVPRGMSR